MGRRMSRNNACTLLECFRSPRERKTADLFHHSGGVWWWLGHTIPIALMMMMMMMMILVAVVGSNQQAAAAASMNHETKIFCGGRTTDAIIMLPN